MMDTIHALELLRHKKHEAAYEEYKSILEISQQDEFRYRNLNNILRCIHFIYIEDKDSFWFDEFSCYLEEYILIARNSDTISWADNILENLLQYTLEVAFIQFSENDLDFSIQKRDLNHYFKTFIVPFIDVMSIRGKRSRKIFYDIILRVIFKERANFERKGHEYQNVVNTVVLSNFFLTITEGERNLNRSRSNLYQLFSELIYSDPENPNQEYFFLTRKAVDYLDMSLKEFPTNQFAKKRKIQLIDSLTIQEQLHRFDHDVSSKISTLNSLIRSLKRKSTGLQEPEQMGRIISDLKVVLDLSRSEAPEPENVDVLAALEEIQDEASTGIEIHCVGETKEWLSNHGYFKVIFENLVKNSREAYKRHAIKIPEPAILIKADFIKDEIIFQDWAGGIPENLLRDDKLFEPYISEKGYAQSTGLGLSLVKKACRMLSLAIKFRVEKNSTMISIKKIEE